ncbi:hypothetical protein MMC18_003137 [Xylographa bjoerkii]|nr:hypothetical protein [Xylographa bjoerkii]
MAESAIIKLQHAFKDKDDKRTPTDFVAVGSPSDPDFEKKPTMAVCRGAELVYEYKDGASIVNLAVALSHYTIESMNQRYEKTKGEWSEFLAAREREDIFEATSQYFKGPEIDQVICTGIGTFSRFHEQDADCNSYNQLAELEVFIRVLKSLGQKFKNEKTDVFMQDPAFNALDEAFLQRRGFNIIKHPEGYNRMTKSTLLYSPGNHDDVAYHAFRVAEPTLFIGNNLAAWGKFNGLPNPDNLGQYHDVSIQNDRSVIDGFLTKRKMLALPSPKPDTGTRSHWCLAEAVYYQE